MRWCLAAIRWLCGGTGGLNQTASSLFLVSIFIILSVGWCTMNLGMECRALKMAIDKGTVLQYLHKARTDTTRGHDNLRQVTSPSYQYCRPESQQHTQR